MLWAVWKYGRTFEHLADLRIWADDAFKSLAESIRQHGIDDPMQSPDGSVLMPIVDSSYIVEMNKRRLTRRDSQPGLQPNANAWDQLGSPRDHHTSFADFALEPRSRRGSRQALDDEKVAIMSAKARGKKPETFGGESAKEYSASMGDIDVVS